MHVPELMSKRTLPDPVIAGKFVCQIRYSEELLILNTIFSFIHVFMPVSLNMLANCLILASISRRKANIHRTRYWSQWIRQFHRHGHLFISPTLTIACILPQLVLTLLFSCVDINTKKYPTLSTNQVIQILLLREDLTKQEATDTDDAAVAYMPRVNQGILFEIMEIVNQPN
ncbi:unnamed protein product [Rotaria sp. Silwood2]|nr:unnamed protein product [Rotaria sp. Silwood2]